MSVTRHPIPWTLLAALLSATAACEFDPPPPPSAFVEVERVGDTVQPSSPEFGVHLALQSWGGASVWLEIAGGTLRGDGQSSVAAACVSVPGGGAFVDLFVIPDDVEALVSAKLYEKACPAGGATRPEGQPLASDTEIASQEVSNSTGSATDDGGGTDDETGSTN